MTRMFIILAVAFMIMQLTSCKGSDVKPFPTKEIYTFFKGQEGCYVANVISTDPIILGPNMKLLDEDCPKAVMGIEYTAIPAVRDWIKEMQDLVKKNCQ